MSVRETFVSSGIFTLAAALTDFRVGSMNLPGLFFMAAVRHLVLDRVEKLHVPHGAGSLLHVSGNPGFPFWPIWEAGHFRDLPVPIFSFHSLFTFVRYSLKM